MLQDGLVNLATCVLDELNMYMYAHCPVAHPLVTMESMATPTMDQKEEEGQLTEVGVAVGMGLVATALAATVSCLDIMG